MMKPHDWNVVVAGHWNPAILTPKGITEIIFQKPEGTPVEIFVPLNAIAPFRVKFDGVIVSADFDKLVVNCEKNDWDVLEKARQSALNAINGLPKTPLLAVGYNVRYQLENPNAEFIPLFATELDKKISDSDFQITGKTINRLLEWKNGRINFQVQSDDVGKYVLLMNFPAILN